MADREGQGAAAPALSDLGALAARLRSIALDRGLTLSTAESCTGGLVGHAITEVPGSSAYFVGGVVSYADALKLDLLGVPPGALERHGAVSAQVARAMAIGIRARLSTDVGVAITGVAGPDGGTAAKPVGLTYVAVAGPADESIVVRRHLWDGDRSANKVASARAALELVLEAVGEPFDGPGPDA